MKSNNTNCAYYVTCGEEHVTTSGSGGNGSSSTGNNGWQPVEELGNNLTDDLDGACSLAGLGVDLNSSSYNISDALLALPLTFKQELPSPGNNQDNGGLFGSSHMSPGSGSSIVDSPQSCSPHRRHTVGGSSSASSSPPHLLQMVKSTCYELNGEQKEKGPIPVCLVIPENHQSTLIGGGGGGGGGSGGNNNNNNSDSSVTDCNGGSSNSNRVKLASPSHELNTSEISNRISSANISSNGSNVNISHNKSLAVLSCAAPKTTTPPPVSSQPAPLSVVVQPSIVHHKHHHTHQQIEHSNEDCRFQYVLAAATSIATKLNEETQTYLNQGQSYEIKLKKLGDLSLYRGKILKSVVRLSFHERRLQYMEGEQMAAWVAAHPSLKILEVDLPLSYGIVDVLQDRSLNTVEFLWDPTKEVGVYIKVNCISTEFTPNKHGGEKGVPFRIQVETYLHSQNSNRKLHTASCQVKVFKLKGADRKHKQDREKILKRPPSEREKYQPSYECTVLNDMPIINDTNTFPASVTSSLQPSPSSDSVNGTVHQTGQHQSQNPPSLVSGGVTSGVSPALPAVEQPSSTVAQSPLSASKILQSPTTSDYNVCETALSSTATVQQATAWLQTNRFSSFVRTFANFSGLDLLRLSCDDLVQICGLPEGIRLYNALHKASWLTLYLCIEANLDVYQALYLASLTNQELKIKIASMLGIPVSQIDELFVRGPNGIHIIITDEVVRNFKDESTYTIEIMQGHAVDCYSLLLKPSASNGNSKC